MAMADRNATVAIVHGDHDELIPVSMGRELARFATSCAEEASLLRESLASTDAKPLTPCSTTDPVQPSSPTSTSNLSVRVIYRELSGATHNGILSTHQQALARVMRQLEP